ncbi:hypothetical protein, partial [Pseudomonas lactis]|uniref:hypothetical protein n=1 Tax=Pseudomonas lactis TaxID=1615674 RepID=UPI003F801247
SVLISGIHVSPTQHDLVYLIAGLIITRKAQHLKNQWLTIKSSCPSLKITCLCNTPKPTNTGFQYRIEVLAERITCFRQRP